MRPIVTTAGPLATAGATKIALAQKPAATFTLNGALVSGGVAYLGAMRRVLFTTVADETGVTFTVTGTNRAGDVISETLAGVNNTTTYTVLDYFTVTSVTVSGSLAGNVTIGTNGIGGSPWVMLDTWALPAVAVQIDVSGTVNYTLQQSLDDPNDPTNPVAAASIVWINSADTTVVGATASAQTNYAFAPRFVRVLLNSGTGSVTATISQLGSVTL